MKVSAHACGRVLFCFLSFLYTTFHNLTWTYFSKKNQNVLYPRCTERDFFFREAIAKSKSVIFLLFKISHLLQIEPMQGVLKSVEWWREAVIARHWLCTAGGQLGPGCGQTADTFLDGLWVRKRGTVIGWVPSRVWMRRRVALVLTGFTF